MPDNGPGMNIAVQIELNVGAFLTRQGEFPQCALIDKFWGSPEFYFEIRDSGLDVLSVY